MGEGAAGIFAHGKDPYFDGWEDTVQLNYASSAVREQMCGLLADVASMCDGVRCDMAMLQCPDVFQQTWGEHLGKQGISCDHLGLDGQLFWPAAIKAARQVNPDFIFIGDVHWGKDHDLQAYGFDFTLDKMLFDQMVERSGDLIRQHLVKEPQDFHQRCAHYLETHEERYCVGTTCMHTCVHVDIHTQHRWADCLETKVRYGGHYSPEYSLSLSLSLSLSHTHTHTHTHTHLHQ